MREFKDDVRDFYESGEDFGKKPLTVELTEEQKKLGALGMAVNAAIVQFVSEGIIPFEEQLHFMMHLGDFAERIYKGESLLMPGTSQTLQINSESGRLYAIAAEQELNAGHQNYLKMKQMQAEMAEEAGQTEQGAQDNVKTLH